MSQPQALPPIAVLTQSILPSEHARVNVRQDAHQARDSGTWSASQTQSKHSSAVSNTAGLQLQTILNAEDSPSRPPSQALQTLPSLGQTFANRHSLDAPSFPESRRSSMDSRVNAGIGHLSIGPSSPYDSKNASRVSLASSLQQQRGITGEQQRNSGVPPPLSPLARQSSLRPNQAPRRAPVISPNPRCVSGMPDPMAASPTKGYAWAFPDINVDRRRSSSGDSSIERSTHSTLTSRQNSFATSINSSVCADTLPAGQRRFDNDMAHTHHHHHPMQHPNITSLQSEHASVPGTGNYSRTPELRVSHKMAERKRRSEMKLLFDELNGILPNSSNNKSSKWEILTKAIDYIKGLQRNHDRSQCDTTRLERQINELQREVQAVWLRLRQVDPNNPHVFGALTEYLAHDQSHAAHGQPNVLPPLREPHRWQQNGVQPATQTSAMQGVEYPAGMPYPNR